MKKGEKKEKQGLKIEFYVSEIARECGYRTVAGKWKIYGIFFLYFILSL